MRWTTSLSIRNYLSVVKWIFIIIAALHFLRIVFAWEAVIGGWSIPMWMSYIVVPLAAILAGTAHRLSK